MYILISAFRVYTADGGITQNLNFFPMLHAVKTDMETTIAE